MSKLLQKITVLGLFITIISVSIYSNVSALDLGVLEPSIPVAPDLPITSEPVVIDTPAVQTPPVDHDENIQNVTGNPDNNSKRKITGEQVLDEDKEVIVEENKKVYPKWQGARKKYVKEHDYYIKVNKKTNTVTIYIKEEDGSLTPYKAMVCSIGRAGHDTPEGTGYKTTDYYDWRLMVDNTYGRYAVRFNGSIMFHSVPYYEAKKNSLEWQDYNKLGGPASLGCIRLAVADAKWIFDNCKRGTEVDVYSGPAKTDPLGTPEPIKLDTTSEYRDWDPTDLTPENPWLVPVE